MPCRRDTHWDKLLDNYMDVVIKNLPAEARQLHKTLIVILDEPMPTELRKVLAGYDANGAFCDKIRACGGTPFLKKLKEEQPHWNVAINRITAWWKRHQAADAIRDEGEAQDAVQL